MRKIILALSAILLAALLVQCGDDEKQGSHHVATVKPTGTA